MTLGMVLAQFCCEHRFETIRATPICHCGFCCTPSFAKDVEQSENLISTQASCLVVTNQG
jgi:hypothetical protein